MEPINVGGIFKEAFLGLTKRISGIELFEREDSALEDGDVYVVIMTKGTFHATITCILDNGMKQTILSGMSRGKELASEEQELLLKEYFNIICGNGLSKINNKIKTASRLTVPLILEKEDCDNESEDGKIRETMMFHSECGNMKVCISHVYAP